MISPLYIGWVVGCDFERTTGWISTKLLILPAQLWFLMSIIRLLHLTGNVPDDVWGHWFALIGDLLVWSFASVVGVSSTDLSAEEGKRADADTLGLFSVPFHPWRLFCIHWWGRQSSFKKSIIDSAELLSDRNPAPKCWQLRFTAVTGVYTEDGRLEENNFLSGEQRWFL